MARATQKKTDEGVARPTGGAKRRRADTAATATEPDIARRAYELYLAGGCVHGRDVEDWLRAEEELM
jgi:hypothetical protein